MKVLVAMVRYQISLICFIIVPITPCNMQEDLSSIPNFGRNTLFDQW